MSTRAALTAFALALSATSLSHAQAVIFDDSNSSVSGRIMSFNPPPQYTYTGPIVFGTETGLTAPGNASTYTASRLPALGPELTQLRLDFHLLASPLPPADLARGIIDLKFQFTTPSPGPLITINSVAAAIVTNLNQIDIPVVQYYLFLTNLDTMQVVWGGQSGCTLSSCTLIDTEANGAITASLQGNQTYELNLVVDCGGAPDFASVLTVPLMSSSDTPYIQIDFAPTFQRLCADQNEDGMITPSDFTAWLANFNANDLRADVNQNAAVEPSDFTAWLAAYNLGLAGPYCTP